MKEKSLNVSTIYHAFMGECNVYGIGVPCTFVRLAGCNLRCYYKTKGYFCDTPEALSATNGVVMSVPDISAKVQSFKNEVVCLTGGEPLLQDVSELLTELSNKGFKVVVETNGSMSVAPYRHIRNVSFVVDVKSPTSGESGSMLKDNYNILDKDDFVKFVIDDEDDYKDFGVWLATYGKRIKCNIAVGLYWGSRIDYKRLMSDISSYGIPIYLNMQTHKMMCLYDAYKNYASFSELFIPKDI